MDCIRLIASDMDATLLDEYSQLPPKFTETIRALAGQGILFAAASGRPLYTLETMFPDLLEEIILIGDNGGAARWKGKDLFVSEMPAEGWRQLARSTSRPETWAFCADCRRPTRKSRTRNTIKFSRIFIPGWNTWMT